MKRSKLIEVYGWRFTSSARILAVIMIVIFGILIAFDKKGQNATDDQASAVEQTM